MGCVFNASRFVHCTPFVQRFSMATRRPGTELRRAKRVPRRQGAWILPTARGIRVPCTLWDISAQGARLAAPHPKSLPANFTLLLSNDGSSRRSCRVVWRSDAQLGVQFIEDLDEECEAAPGRPWIRRGHPKPAPAAAAPTQGERKPSLLKIPSDGAASAVRARRANRNSAAVSKFLAALLTFVVAGAAILWFVPLPPPEAMPWANFCGSESIFCGHPELPAIAAVLLIVLAVVARKMAPD